MRRYGLNKYLGAPERYREYASLLAHLGVVLPHQGMCRVDDLLEVDFSSIQLELLDTHIEGPMPCYQAVVSSLMKQSDGRIMHIFYIPHTDLYKSAFVAFGYSLIL